MVDNQLKQAAIGYLTSLRKSGISDLPVAAENRLATLRIDDSVADQAEAVSDLVKNQASASSVAQTKATYSVNSENADTGSAPRDLFLADKYGQPLSLENRSQRLTVLSQQVAQCTKCDELVQCRKQTVFGVGNPEPRLCFLGEGPGAEEDRRGEPFVGPAGQLLDKIITGGLNMRREDVYILNTVKCRPPRNRNPRGDELANCWQYAERQLEILQPEFICCLGGFAARMLLQSTESVGRLRGRFHQYRGSQVVVTYHPAFLLRTPEVKEKTWEDMKMLMDRMGIEY